MPVISYIGIGANLADPVQQILDARRHLLADSQVHFLECSSLYLSSPVGYQDQADFINCVCQIETDHSAQALLLLTQNIESKLGRQRDLNNRNAPRLIDLDILLHGDQSIQSRALTVPHARMAERLFVLEPIFEISPDLSINGLGKVSMLLENGRASGLFEGQTLYRLS
ncbi:UNVERIFIED_CONTAM: hypothetical protein GTU68_061763 [Idotea baltica]|nr:hypothetical protein [Idotea baltica]